MLIIGHLRQSQSENATLRRRRGHIAFGTIPIGMMFVSRQVLGQRASDRAPWCRPNCFAQSVPPDDANTCRCGRKPSSRPSKAPRTKPAAKDIPVRRWCRSYSSGQSWAASDTLPRRGVAGFFASACLPFSWRAERNRETITLAEARRKQLWGLGQDAVDQVTDRERRRANRHRILAATWAGQFADRHVGIAAGPRAITI